MRSRVSELCIDTAVLMRRGPTDSVTLPASTSLPIAGAVHHVALIMALGKFLVYFIVHAVDDALVWTHGKEWTTTNF